ncbi:MAG: TlpA family protein disulfide reductase [Bdellovibrionales bacterium]|nr:TlpA family protein disulfide reductase [Bdellovibrionales bacterium]
MFRLSSLLLIVLSFVLSGCSSKLPEPLPVGVEAPLARLSYADGGYDSLASFRGSRVVLFFWAEWCSKSRRSMEGFNDLARQYEQATRGGSRAPSTVFLAVDLDEYAKKSSVEAYLKKQGYTAPRHIFSGNGGDDETALAFQVFTLPRFFVVGPTGRIELSTDSVGELEDFLGY